MSSELSSPGLHSRPGIRDALYAGLLMFPAAGIVALVYRFPLPFGGSASGPAGVWDAMMATLFFGLVGGFIIVPLAAAGLGAFMRRHRSTTGGAADTLPSAIAAVLYALLLAVLTA
jgi:hypothetical protein